MKILELSSGCAYYLPGFLDSSWLGLTESRSFPTRIAMMGPLELAMDTSHFPVYPLLGAPVT
jgi:hypothetical protein